MAAIIHEYKAGLIKYRITPTMVRSESFWILEVQQRGQWQQLSSLGTPVMKGHLLPYFHLAHKGMRAHARANGEPSIINTITYEQA